MQRLSLMLNATINNIAAVSLSAVVVCVVVVSVVVVI
jgi:hypothetical protein